MYTRVTDAGLAQLASAEALEELTIDHEAVSLAGLRAVRTIKRLHRLHLDQFGGPPKLSELKLDDDHVAYVPTSDFNDCVEALKALRQSHPGIVIDNDTAIGGPWPYEALPPQYEMIPGPRRDWTLRFFREWNRRYRGR